MPGSIWETIALTPWWFYAVLVYFFYIAYLNTKPHNIPKINLVIFPALFILLFLVSLVYLVPITVFNGVIWFIAMLLGVLLGWLQFKLNNVRAIKEKNLLHFPGSFSLFVTLIILVSVKFYFFGHHLNLDPVIFREQKYAIYAVVVGGLLTGLYFGRVIYIKQCFKYGPYEDSKK